MPQPVYRECFAIGDTKSCLLTEHLRLSQSQGMYLNPLNPPQDPLDGYPGKRTFASSEILHHELSSRSQQPLQSCQSRCWLLKVVQCIRESDQVKRFRRVEEARPLASTD